MTAEDILHYCHYHLEGISDVNSWGEKGIFYNPGNKLKRGVYILTIKEKDGENDSGSHLNRDGIWRLNLGVRKATFQKLFGELPKRPEKGGVVDMPYDFTVSDVMMPHPVYAWMGWVCVLNPSNDTFERIKPLIQEAYEYAKENIKSERYDR